MWEESRPVPDCRRQGVGSRARTPRTHARVRRTTFIATPAECNSISSRRMTSLRPLVRSARDIQFSMTTSSSYDSYAYGPTVCRRMHRAPSRTRGANDLLKLCMISLTNFRTFGISERAYSCVWTTPYAYMFWHAHYVFERDYF